MNKFFIILLMFVFSPTFFLIPSENGETISIPLRFTKGIPDSYQITSNNFKMYINKKPVEIKNIKKTERSLGTKPMLGRNFILSFGNFYNYDKSLADGISYFVTEILSPSDSLILLTPDKLFQIKISENRERIIFTIEDILAKYFKEFSKHIFRYSKGINSELIRLKNYFESYNPENRMVAEGYLYFETLTKLATEISFLKKFFISPTKKSSNEAEALLGLREGDRIWIHFQNSSIYPFENKLQNALKWIKYHMSMTTLAESSWQKVVKTRLSVLEQSLLLSDVFPLESLRKKFTDTNTTFFSLLLKTSGKEEGILSVITADIEKMLQRLSHQTGGIYFSSENAELSLRKMKDHRDVFFKIFFDLKKSQGDKNIVIIPNLKGSEIIYKTRITAKEISDIINYKKNGKLNINSYKIKNRKVSFNISSYSKKKDEKIGLIKVVIELFDGNRKKRYSTSNILRATKKSIKVNAKLPSSFKGNYILKLSILDLISNRMITKETPVKLL